MLRFIDHIVVGNQIGALSPSSQTSGFVGMSQLPIHIGKQDGMMQQKNCQHKKVLLESSNMKMANAHSISEFYS